MIILLFYIRNRNQTTTRALIAYWYEILFYIRNRNQTTTRVPIRTGEEQNMINHELSKFAVYNYYYARYYNSGGRGYGKERRKRIHGKELP